MSFHSQLGIICEGYLLKLPPKAGLLSKWRKRWFVLTPRAMVYFKDPAHSIPRGMISLSKAVLMGPASTQEGMDRTFHVRVSEGRTYHLRAATATEMGHWITAVAIQLSKI